MATTTTTTATKNETITYALLVIFTVDANPDARLHDQQAIREQAAGWITGLDAKVQGVNIRKAD